MSRMRSTCAQRALAALVAALGLLAAAATVGAPEDESRQAVALARGGEHDTAVAILQRLRVAHPDNRQLLFDLLTVLNWAGRHDRVVALGQTVNPGSLPQFALRALAHSTARAGDAADGVSLYRRLVSGDEAGDGDYAGYSRVLADAGDHGHAIAVARTAMQRFGPSTDNLHAAAYAHFSAGELAHVIAWCDKALALDADHAGVFWLKVRSLERIGATGPAERMAGSRPDLLGADDRLHVHNDRNATWVRWGSLDQGDIESTYRDTDIALARLDALQRRLDEFPEVSDRLARVIRFDRIIALHQRRRMVAAVAEYESLVADAIEVPAYARRSVAGAYLHLRQPDAAEVLYRGVIDELANDFEARSGLFYSLLEQEDFSAARDVIERLIDGLAAFRRSENGKFTYPNYDWLGASITAAMMEAYADRLDVALDRIDTLRSRAPHDARLHRELSTLYRWRGWARAALRQARIGRTNFPDDVGLAVAEATALLELRRPREAEEQSATLFALLPNDTAVNRLRRDLETLASPVMEINMSRTRSDSSNLVRGERGLAFGFRLDSAPINYRSRLFVAADRRSSTFPESDRRHDRVAAGYAYRHGPLHGSLAATSSTGDLSRSGVAAGAGVLASDHFRADIAYDSVSLETPLRALGDGTYADRLQLSLAYEFHESRRLAAQLGRMQFTDGNRREFVSLSWEERWYSGPIYRLYSFVDGYASDNTATGVDYFNPESDDDLNLTVRQRWKTWREYERSLHQVLDLAVGRYRQAGFDDGDTWSVRYELVLEHEDQYLLSGGVRRGRDFYDGEPEYVDEVFVRFNRIF